MIQSDEASIHLALTGGLVEALAVIGTRLAGLEGQVKRVQAALTELGTAGHLVRGVLLGIAGIEIFKGMKAGLDHAKEHSHELVQMQRLGMSAADYTKAYNAVMALPAAVPGTTSATGPKVYAELFSVLGADETTGNLERLSAFTMSLANTKGITLWRGSR